MKANIFVYRTNGSVEKFFVNYPEVGMYNQSNEVGIFNHCSYRIAVDDYDERYEEVVLYWTTEVACIYADNKCVWHNPAYIKDNTSMKKSQEELYSENLDLDIEEEYVEGMFDFSDQDPLYC